MRTLTFLLLLLLASCTKAPKLHLSSNKEMAAPGDTITLSYTATHKRAIREINVELYRVNGESGISELESQLFHSKDKQKDYSGTFAFQIPENLNTNAFGAYETYFEFRVSCKAMGTNASKSISVKVGN